MADDGGDPPPGDVYARTRRSGGMSLKTVIKMLGYLSGPIFALWMGWLVFGPMEFDTPEEVAGLFGPFNFSIVLYLAIQITLIIAGSGGRNITKDSVTLVDIAFSLPIFLVPIGAGFLGYAGTFIPQGLDFMLIMTSIAVGLLDCVGFTIMLIRSNRRGSEVTREG